MFYTKEQINTINSKRIAVPNARYYQDNGIVWLGTNTKTLIIIEGIAPLPIGAATENTLLDVTTPLDVQPVSIIGVIPIPTGASTEATLIQVRDYLDTVEIKLASLITNTTGLSIEATQIQVRDYLDTVEIKLQSIITVLGSPFQSGGSISNTSFISNAGTNLNTSALALESTQALIKTNTDKIPVQGQALAASSLPIVLTAIQQAALTPPAAITGFALAANQQTNAITDAQIRATPLPISVGVVSIKEQPDATSIYSPNNSTSVAYENNRIVKSTSGTLYSVTGYNSKLTTQFIQIHNTGQLPIDGVIPIVLLTVPGLSNFSYSSDKFGRFFSNGITVCNSLTGSTKTIGLADVWFDIQYT